MTNILLIKNIKIHNANALSSPYTIGFPAMTAWIGAVHALERHLKKIDWLASIRFKGIAVSCHDIDLQTSSEGNYTSLISVRKPLKEGGKLESFIPEARCHLTISLIIEYENIDIDKNDAKENLTAEIIKIMNSKMKFAGGDILKFNKNLKFITIYDKDISKIRSEIMPGYLLVERRDLIIKEMEENNLNSIDAMLSYLAITVATNQETDIKSKIYKRKAPGWIVPIAIGFQGISELGKAKNQRDNDTPHRFAEPIVTLGEFKMAYHIKTFKDFEEMLWYYHFDETENLYLCQQTNKYNS